MEGPLECCLWQIFEWTIFSFYYLDLLTICIEVYENYFIWKKFRKIVTWIKSNKINKIRNDRKVFLKKNNDLIMATFPFKTFLVKLYAIKPVFPSLFPSRQPIIFIRILFRAFYLSTLPNYPLKIALGSPSPKTTGTFWYLIAFSASYLENAFWDSVKNALVVHFTSQFRRRSPNPKIHFMHFFINCYFFLGKISFPYIQVFCVFSPNFLQFL